MSYLGRKIESIRPFRNGRGSFEGIMKNVLPIVDSIDVDIGGNFTVDNVESFFRLLDCLQEKGLADKLHQAGFQPVIRETEKENPLCADMGCIFSESEIMENMINLRRATLERGFPTDSGIGMHL